MQIVDPRDGRVWYRSQLKQTLFHNLIETREETGLRYFLYGGAAKGGKSEALRHQAHSDCLTYAGIKVLLIRSQLTELKRTHIRRLITDLPLDWFKFNITDHLVTYPNQSLLEFGFFDRPDNLKRYLSAEYDVILIDELTTISFEIFLLLTSRLAASRQDFIPYIACATNPGDVAHREVKSYFIEKDFHIEFPEMVSMSAEGVQEYDPHQVAFVPARIFDNPILIDRDPGILKRLRSLPPKERKRFYEGSWEIFEGQFFDMLNRQIHDFTDEQMPEYSKLHGAMDYGNFACCYVGPVDNAGNGYLRYEWVENDPSKELEDYAYSFKNFCFYNGLRDFTVVCDTDMFMTPRKKYGGEQKVVDVFRQICNMETSNLQCDTCGNKYLLTPSPLPNGEGQVMRKPDEICNIQMPNGIKCGGILKGEILTGLNIAFVQVSKTQSENKSYRVYCNRFMKDKWSWSQDKNGYWIKKPKIYVSTKCKWFWKTVPALIVSKLNEEDIDQGTGIDHPYDASKIWGTTMTKSLTPAQQKSNNEELRRQIRAQFTRSM